MSHGRLAVLLGKSTEFIFIGDLSFSYAIIRAFAGGWLERPQDRFPGAFSGVFWAEYPYFLPCAVMTLISIIGCLALTVGLDEVNIHVNESRLKIITKTFPDNQAGISL